MNQELDYIPDVMTNVGGWLGDKEAVAFHNHAKACSRGVIVEIGAWQGKSTIFLGRGSKAGRGTKIYSIDPHIGSEEHQGNGAVWTFEKFKENIKNFQVDHLVEPIVKMSWDAVGDVKEPIEFLFIDGAHDYTSVKRDIADWFPKLMDGGWVCFHDSDWPGVKQALYEDIYSSNQTADIHRVLGTTYARKVSQNTAMDRALNQLKWLQFSVPIEYKNLRRKLFKRQKKH